MRFSCLVHFFFLLVAVAIIPCIHALNYHVINKDPSTPEGQFFNKQIGKKFAKAKMREAVNFIWKTFKQDSEYERKIVKNIKLIIDAEESSSSYNIHEEEIHLSAKFIEDQMISGGNINKAKRILSGVLYQLVTYVLQWDTEGIPPGLREGIAQYVLFKAGYIPTTKLKLQKGDRWDKGGDVTLHFLVYCESLKEGFVADLNDMMKSVYQESYFSKLLGKDVNVVWAQFKTNIIF